jgi:hypothetical protein
MDRTRLVRIGGIVGGIVALALVILGVAAISAPKGSTPELPVITASGSGGPDITSTGTTSTTGSGGSSPTTQAGSPGSGPLATTAGGSSGSSGGSGGTSGGSGSGGSGSTQPKPKPGPTAPIGDMLPVSIAGYSMGRVLVTNTAAVVSLDPVSGEAADKVARALMTVHDRGDDAGAQRFVVNVSKRAYPKNGSTFPVSGAVAYFGTDGMRAATAAFASGRFVYEVIVTSRDGEPAELSSQGKTLAAAFRPLGR